MRVPDDLAEKVLIYQSTPEGENLWRILGKVDRYCSNWMHAFLWMRLKCELFIQVIEFHHHEEIDG